MDEEAKEKILRVLLSLFFSLIFLIFGIVFIINTIMSDLETQSKIALYSIGGAFLSIGVKLFPTKA